MAVHAPRNRRIMVHTRDLQGSPRLRIHAAGVSAAILAAVSAVLIADALTHRRAFFDLAVLQAIQRVDPPMIEIVLRPVDLLTSAVGAITAWALLLVALAAARWWLPALATLTLPAAGALDNAIGLFIVS